METYEIAILAHISMQDLVDALNIFTEIPSCQIVEFADYIQVMGLDIPLIGIEIYYQYKCFNTWISLHTSNYEFNDLNFLMLSLAMAKRFETEVAIADPIWKGEPEVCAQIIISTQEKYKKAFLFDGDNFFELIPHIDEGYELGDVSELIEKLSQKKF
jgi:hypothetical protein